jgi:O-antigen/teichoic acid export membrane protein
MTAHVRHFGGNAMIYGIGTMISRFISLLLLPLFTSVLTPADYGLLAMLALLGQVAQPIFSLGVGAGMGPTYFEGTSEARKASSVWTAATVLVFSGAVMVLLAWTLAPQLSRVLFGAADAPWLVTLSLLGVAINNAAVPFSLRLQFENRAVPFVIITCASAVLSILTSVFLVMVLRWGVAGMVLAQLLGYTINAALFVGYVYSWTRGRFDRHIARELLSLSLPLVPSFGFLFVLMHGNKYILQSERGLAAVGVYSIGFNFGAAISIVVGAITTAWYPFFMSFLERQQEASEPFGRIFSYYVIGLGTIVLAMFVAARPVVAVMTHSSFHAAYRAVGLVATAHYLTGIFSLLLPGMYFAKEVRYISVIQGIAVLMYAAAAMTLIPAFGVFGAALSLAIGHLTMVAAVAAFNRHRGDRYVRIDYAMKPLAVFSAFFAVVATLSLMPYPFVWWQQSVGVPIVLLIVFGVAWTLLSPKDRDALLALVDRRLRRAPRAPAASPTPTIPTGGATTVE